MVAAVCAIVLVVVLLLLLIVSSRGIKILLPLLRPGRVIGFIVPIKIPRKSTGINFNKEAAALYLNEPVVAAFLSSPMLLPAPFGMLVEDFVYLYLCMIVGYGLEL